MGWRQHALSNGLYGNILRGPLFAVVTAAFRCCPWDAQKPPLHSDVRGGSGGCCAIMDVIRGTTAVAVRVLRFECLKWAQGNLGTSPLLDLSHPSLSCHPAQDHTPAASCGPRFSFTPASFAPAACHTAAEWIPPCSSSCCTWWSRTTWSAAGCSTGDRAPSLANELTDLCWVPGMCECV